MLLFIIPISQMNKTQLNFNTSHVTVYRKIKGANMIELTDFNTSHVTVYQGGATVEYNVSISIHLMLLFIILCPCSYCI